MDNCDLSRTGSHPIGTHYWHDNENRPHEKTKKINSKVVTSCYVYSYEEFCAHYIQNWWSKIRRKERGSPHSLKLATTSAVQSVSVVISPSAAASPSSKPNRQPKTKVREGPLQQVEAATLIQRSWRRHIVSSFNSCLSQSNTLRLLNLVAVIVEDKF